MNILELDQVKSDTLPSIVKEDQDLELLLQQVLAETYQGNIKRFSVALMNKISNINENAQPMGIIVVLKNWAKQEIAPKHLRNIH